MGSNAAEWLSSPFPQCWGYLLSPPSSRLAAVDFIQRFLKAYFGSWMHAWRIFCGSVTIFSNLVDTCPCFQQTCSHLAVAPGFIRSQATTLAWHQAWNNPAFSQQRSLLSTLMTSGYLRAQAGGAPISRMCYRPSQGKHPTLFSVPTQDQAQQAFPPENQGVTNEDCTGPQSHLTIRAPQRHTTSTPSLFQGSWCMTTIEVTILQ